MWTAERKREGDVFPFLHPHLPSEVLVLFKAIEGNPNQILEV